MRYYKPMKFKLLFLSFLLAQHLFSQVADRKFAIVITATTSVSGEKFLININKNKRDLKILYSIRDSVAFTSLEQNKYHQLYKDTLLILFSNLNQNKKTFKFYMDKMDSLYELYTYYSKDSIILKPKKNRIYSNFLKEIFLTPTEMLENKEANKNRITVDGTSCKFHLISSGQNRIVYAHSPRIKSHPLLYQLISETLALYRKTHNTQFLDKRRTSGY